MLQKISRAEFASIDVFNHIVYRGVLHFTVHAGIVSMSGDRCDNDVVVGLPIDDGKMFVKNVHAIFLLFPDGL